MLPYRYKPLQHADSIRLVQIHHPAFEDSIQITLIHTRLGSCPPYIALSYPWGEQTAGKDITVDGRFLQVTNNLECALRQLHGRQGSDGVFRTTEGMTWIAPSNDEVIFFGMQIETSYYWIDALCINQGGNAAERSSQVRSMDKIYRGAQGVCAYLGEEQPGISIDDAIYFMEALSSYRQAVMDIHEATLFRSATRVRKMRALWQDIDNHMARDMASSGRSFRSLVSSRAYFSRRWVRQEYALAQWFTMTVGSKNLNPFTVLQTVSTLGQLLEPEDQASLDDFLEDLGSSEPVPLYDGEGSFQEVDLAISFFRTRPDTIVEVLFRCVNTKATVMLDDIYSIQGICTDPFISNIVPDYSLSIGTLFGQVTRLLIEHRQDLQPFLMMMSRPSDMDRAEPTNEVPSWVLDFHGSLPAVGFGDHNATGGRSVQMSHGKDPSIMCLKGIEVDEVTALGQCGENSLVQMIWEVFHQHEQQLRYCSHAELYDAVVGSITSPLAQTMKLDPTVEGLVKEIKSSDDLDEGQIEKHAMTCWSLRFHAIKHKLFITRNGFIGGANFRDIELGDRIVLLYGGTWPFVLRPQESQWKIIGACYVHGIMQGEALARDDVVEQIFQLI